MDDQHHRAVARRRDRDAGLRLVRPAVAAYQLVGLGSPTLGVYPKSVIRKCPQR